eukprot:TRINITY_DN9994_c0_g1_i1.p1 TRINITY_DN9994_c0_g1~~TRINITY_DN9994_c0_g1_i1.p1  ORF type:complete len:1761 (+),score=514.35 TRINITY_DN9994_c0_g1_i1:629-5284(+)
MKDIAAKLDQIAQQLGVDSEGPGARGEGAGSSPIRKTACFRDPPAQNEGFGKATAETGASPRKSAISVATDRSRSSGPPEMFESATPMRAQDGDRSPHGAATHLKGLLQDVWAGTEALVSDMKAMVSLSRSTFDVMNACKKGIDGIGVAGEALGSPLPGRDSPSPEVPGSGRGRGAKRSQPCVRPLDSAVVAGPHQQGVVAPLKEKEQSQQTQQQHKVVTKPQLATLTCPFTPPLDYSSPERPHRGSGGEFASFDTRHMSISFAEQQQQGARPVPASTRGRMRSRIQPNEHGPSSAASIPTSFPSGFAVGSPLLLPAHPGVSSPTCRGAGAVFAGNSPKEATTPVLRRRDSTRRKSLFREAIRTQSLAPSDTSSTVDIVSLGIPSCLASDVHSDRVLQALYRVVVASAACTQHDFSFQVARELAGLARCEEVGFGCGEGVLSYPGVSASLWTQPKSPKREHATAARRQMVADGTTTALKTAEFRSRQALESNAFYDDECDRLRGSGELPDAVLLISVACEDEVLGIVKFAARADTAPLSADGDSWKRYPCDKDEIHPFCTVGAPPRRHSVTPPAAVPREGLLSAVAPEDVEAVKMFLHFLGPVLFQYKRQMVASDELQIFSDIADVLTDIGTIDTSDAGSMRELIELTTHGAGVLVPSECITMYLCCNVPDTYVKNGAAAVAATSTSGLVQHAVGQGESCFTNDPMAHPGFSPNFTVYDTGDRVRGVMAVPVVLEDGRVSGVIELLNRRSRGYDDHDVKRIESLAAYTAIALRNHVSASALRALNLQAASMVSICRDLAAVSLHQHTLIERIMRQAQELVNADHAALFIVDWGRKSLFCTLQGREHVLPLNEGLLGMVTNTGAPINMHDVGPETRTDFGVHIGYAGQVNTVLAVPVRKDGGEIVAVARVLNKRDEYGNVIAFTPADEQVLDMFSTFAGISLMISEQYKAAERDKTRVRDMLDALVGMADTDIRTGPQQVCLSIMRHAKALLQAERSVMYLVDKERSELVCSAGKGVGRHSIPLDSGVMAQVYRTGRTVNLSNAKAMILDDAVGATNCLLAAPVRLQNEVVAVVCVTGKAGTHYDAMFDEEDEEAIEFFCTLAGIFIGNAQLFEFATNGNTELSKVLVRLGTRQSVSDTSDDMHINAKTRGRLKEENMLFRKVSEIDGSALEKGMELLPTHGFDVLRYIGAPDGQEQLLFMVAEMFQRRGLSEAFGLKRPTLLRLLARISVGYRKVPYHNAYHAIDVTQTLYRFIVLLAPSRALTKLEEMTLLMCGLCHDIDHMGLNNSFHYKAETPLGILSNATGGSSPLEIHHLSYSMDVLQQPEYNIFAHIPNPADEIAFYKTFVQLILGTDMAKHDELCERLKPIDAAARGDPQHRELLLTVLLKAADVSNCTKPFELSQKWARRVVEEFFFQGDREQQQIGEISNAMFDRNSRKEMAETQLGFIRFVAKPFYKLVTKVWPELKYMYEQLLENEDQWQAMDNTKGAKASALADHVSRNVQRSSAGRESGGTTAVVNQREPGSALLPAGRTPGSKRQVSIFGALPACGA